jgi:NitT/TauT family transport system permease protein
MKKLLKPFNTATKRQGTLIYLGWFLLILLTWTIYSATGKSLFPSIASVGSGFVALLQQGLVPHIFSSLSLCFSSIVISIIISSIIAYLSPIPLLKPLSTFISQLRFLPLTGITFYLAMMIESARTMQVWVLVIFMSTYLTTSLLAMIKDIPEEEIDHARTLKCSRWEVLWEVVIKGRLDYLFDVIRQNLAIVWMMLVTVESILAASGGLGFLIKNSDKFMNHSKIIALQLVILFIGVLLNAGLNFLRKRLFTYSNF